MGFRKLLFKELNIEKASLIALHARESIVQASDQFPLHSLFLQTNRGIYTTSVLFLAENVAMQQYRSHQKLTAKGKVFN